LAWWQTVFGVLGGRRDCGAASLDKKDERENFFRHARAKKVHACKRPARSRPAAFSV
jgi:hypothetical protein